MTSQTTARPRPPRRLAAAALALTLVAGTAAAVVGTARSSEASAPVTAKGDVILNMFQWNWSSVAAECGRIGAAGFAYVQVSPPQESVTGSQWWTSYQPVSYKIDSKLGNRSQFATMVSTCKDAGVGIIADAVINHTTGADRGSGTGTAGSSYGIDSFPAVPYSASDFNDCRTNISNYGDRYQVQNCRLSSLQDLRTGSDYVRGKIAGYLNDLLSLGVAGFRIDAAKHIPAADLAAIKAKLTNSSAYWVQEVIGASGEPVQPSEYVGVGDVHEFNYARTLKNAFNGQIASLKNIANGLLPSNQAGVFVDNHDTERNGETMNATWGAKYLLANAFLLGYPYGSPSVYTGYTFTDKDAGAPGATDTSVPDASCSNAAWTCMQRKTEITGMVGFHNAVAGTAVTNWYDDGNNVVGFGRGAKGFVVLNNQGSSSTRTWFTSLPDGTYCDVVAATDCSRPVTVSGGSFTATVPAYGALAIHVGRTSGTTSSPTTSPTSSTGATTVYYSTSKTWSAYKVHYQVGGGAWTTVPGETMTAACSGWVSRQIAAGGATITAAFNDGNGTWDNNGSKNYALSGSVAAVKDGAVSSTDPCASSTPSPTPTPTPTPTASPTSGTTAVTFGVNATTTWGQNVYVVGDLPALGSWNPAAGVALSSAAYPVWRTTLNLPAGTSFQYKYVKRDGSGNVVWESGANRTGTATGSTLTFTDTWR